MGSVKAKTPSLSSLGTANLLVDSWLSYPWLARVCLCGKAFLGITRVIYGFKDALTKPHDQLQAGRACEQRARHQDEAKVIDTTHHDAMLEVRHWYLNEIDARWRCVDGADESFVWCDLLFRLIWDPFIAGRLLYHDVSAPLFTRTP